MEGSNNHYNCPIVTSYSENIKNNVEELRDESIRFMNPFLALDNLEKLKERLVQEIGKTFNIPDSEINLAAQRAWG